MKRIFIATLLFLSLSVLAFADNDGYPHKGTYNPDDAVTFDELSDVTIENLTASSPLTIEDGDGNTKLITADEYDGSGDTAIRYSNRTTLPTFNPDGTEIGEFYLDDLKFVDIVYNSGPLDDGFGNSIIKELVPMWGIYTPTPSIDDVTAVYSKLATTYNDTVTALTTTALAEGLNGFPYTPVQFVSDTFQYPGDSTSRYCKQPVLAFPNRPITMTSNIWTIDSGIAQGSTAAITATQAITESGLRPSWAAWNQETEGGRSIEIKSDDGVDAYVNMTTIFDGATPKTQYLALGTVANCDSRAVTLSSYIFTKTESELKFAFQIRASSDDFTYGEAGFVLGSESNTGSNGAGLSFAYPTDIFFFGTRGTSNAGIEVVGPAANYCVFTRKDGVFSAVTDTGIAKSDATWVDVVITLGAGDGADGGTYTVYVDSVLAASGTMQSFQAFDGELRAFFYNTSNPTTLLSMQLDDIAVERTLP